MGNYFDSDNSNFDLNNGLETGTDKESEDEYLSINVVLSSCLSLNKKIGSHLRCLFWNEISHPKASSIIRSICNDGSRRLFKILERVS